MGLSIANKLLALMGSKLQLQSEPGKGSTFYFEVGFSLLAPEGGTAPMVPEGENNAFLPVGGTGVLKEMTEKKPTTIPPSGERGLGLGLGLKILLAEDNLVNIALARILIKKLLPEVTLIEAVNGKIAVEKFTSEQPHLVFMDIQMPVMNGYDAAREIRKIEGPLTPEGGKASSPFGGRGAVPIIALTAGTVKGEKEKCLEAGMDDYISKPIVGGALEAVIEKWLFKNSSNVE